MYVSFMRDNRGCEVLTDNKCVENVLTVFFAASIVLNLESIMTRHPMCSHENTNLLFFCCNWILYLTCQQFLKCTLKHSDINRNQEVECFLKSLSLDFCL